VLDSLPDSDELELPSEVLVLSLSSSEELSLALLEAEPDAEPALVLVATDVEPIVAVELGSLGENVPSSSLDDSAASASVSGSEKQPLRPTSSANVLCMWILPSNVPDPMVSTPQIRGRRGGPTKQACERCSG
jgi:hypothetical protein